MEASAPGSCGVSAPWNDDFHHSAMVALTGRAEAYYADTTGDPQEFVSAAKYGYLFQGQYYHWQDQPRGRPHGVFRQRPSSSSPRITTRSRTPHAATEAIGSRTPRAGVR